MPDSDYDSDAPEAKVRRFDFAPENELLPLKINGKLVRQYKTIQDEIKTEEDELTNDLSKLTPDTPERELTVQELLFKQKTCLTETKQKISSLSNSIINFPDENFGRIKDLRELCLGIDADSLVRETAQKLAIASLTEVFISIVPGYQIRTLTEAEQNQKMKAETKKVFNFEVSLLNNYQKFLQTLEKNAMKLTKLAKGANNFSAKLGMLSARCLCKLLKKISHFNFNVDIIACLVQLTRSLNPKVVIDVCNTFSEVYKEDHLLEISMQITKAISNFVNAKKGNVKPLLLCCFLSLKIKEVEKTSKAEQEEKKKKKQKFLQGQRFSRKTKKDIKRRRKIEDPLLEAEAAEKISTKLKFATETMKFVFTTYFRILKRMPTTNLIEPVLEGLAKFAHLINVEFFDDLVSSLSKLVCQKHLRFSDSLRCIKTVCVILSHEGQALNIDPLKFYNALFELLPSIAFQNNDAIPSQIEHLTDCFDVLLIKRRRLVPLKRVAAFIKRSMLLLLILPTNNTALCLISTIRTSHPGLIDALVNTENDEDCVMNGIFMPDSIDPDSSNSLCSDIVHELRLIIKNTNNLILRAFCTNILHQIPSNGEHRLSAQWATRSPNSWLTEKSESKIENDENPIKQQFTKFASKQKVASSNVCSTLCTFVAQS